MTNFNLKPFTGTLQDQTTQLISARDLHKMLQIQTRFDTWISRRINDYQFAENLDFIECSSLSNRGFFETKTKDYHITLDMAKELCMLEKNALGQQARRYFIRLEKVAKKAIPALQNRIVELENQLYAIPAYLRENPTTQQAIVKTAQLAFLTAHPECKKLIHYRNLGLTNPEIAKLTALSPSQVERRLKPCFQLGLLTRRQTPTTQLATI